MLMVISNVHCGGQKATYITGWPYLPAGLNGISGFVLGSLSDSSDHLVSNLIKAIK